MPALVLRSVLLVLFIVNVSSAFAQTITHTHGAQTVTHTVTAANGEDYQLHVHLPAGYDTGTRYPVIYYPDAWWLQDLMQGAYTLAQLSSTIRPLILVGISQPGDEEAWNRQRTRDLTPTPYALGLPMQVSGVPVDSTNTGGAADFLAFLQDTAAPFIEANYAASTSQRGYLGHSFGGLFGTWAMQQAPTFFDDLILISPSVWWNRREFLDADNFAALTTERPSLRVFVTVGSNEGMMLRGYNQLAAQLDSLAWPGLTAKSRIYDGADHYSQVPAAIYDGLAWLYATE